MLIYFIFSFVRFKLVDFSINKKQENIFLFLVLLVFGFPFFINANKYDVNLNVLLFKDIYLTRSLFTSQNSSLVNYSYFWLIKILAPVLFIYGLINKKYTLSVIAFSILTFIYLVSGHRSVYFAFIILVAFYYIRKSFIEKTLSLIQFIFISIFFFVPLLDFLLTSRIFKFMLFERVFFDQSLQTYFYYDYFKYKPIYFSESLFFNKIFTYPYELPSSNLIASIYYNSKEQQANTGIIGDAFMNLGYLGVVIISIIFSSFFAFFNSIKIDERYFGIFIMYIFDFQNSSFLSILFSGGFFFLILFSMTIMKKRV